MKRALAGNRQIQQTARSTLILGLILFGTSSIADSLAPAQDRADKHTKHSYCQNFTEPVFFKRLPAPCAEDEKCTKKLQEQICQAKNEHMCRKFNLWTPITEFITLPFNAKIIDQSQLHDQQKGTVLYCIYFNLGGVHEQ